MESEYILREKPGYDIREVGRHPTFWNSVIYEYQYGRIVNIYPVTSTTLYLLKPKLPPEYYSEEKIEKISLDKPLPSGYFASGISPFIQIIYRKALETNGATMRELYESIVKEYAIAPDTPETMKMIEQLVKWASSPGGPSYLLRYIDSGITYYRTGKAITGYPPLVEYRRGVDPIKDQICKLIENLGITSYGEIKKYIMDSLGWLSDEKYLVECLNDLVKNKNIEIFEKNYYKFVKRLETF